LRRAQRERVEEGPPVFHRHLANFGDRPPLDFHGARLSAQPRPLAIRTRRVTAIAAQKHANVQLVFLALEPAEESFDAREILLRVALENRVALRCGQVAEWHVDWNTLRARVLPHLHRKLSVLRLGPRLDRAVPQRPALVRHYAIEVEIDRVPEAL